MANQLFNTVVSKIPRKNLFKMPFESILSAQFGALTPAGIFEMFPGDVFMDSLEGSIKLAPMKAPAFSRIDATFHFFFVPRRLLYDEFEDFVTGGTTGTFAQDVSPLSPVAPAFSFEELAKKGKLKDGSLADYLGMPSESDQGTFVGVPPIDAMPFAGYHKIYSDWYRDELLDTEEFEPLSSGSIGQGTELFEKLTALRYRAWHKDYFTSARPDTQLGPEVGVPISGEISGNGPFRLSISQSLASGFTAVARRSAAQEQLEDGRFAAPLVPNATGYTDDFMQYSDGLSLDNALMLINDLRKSVKLQEWREKNMRGGNRYIENMYHHFGVKSSDARLQRSQYLGGKKIPVVVGEVLQSVSTENDSMYGDAGAVLGTRGGVANAAGRTQRIRFFAEEHGFVYCLMSILPHAAYMQGIPRMFANRWDPMEYLWPEFGNLGEQEVYNWEIFVQEGSNPVNGGNAGTFGYQSRYADLKTRFNEIHGEFRSSLDFWHNARIFDSAPALNKNFVYFDSDDEAEGQNRIFAIVKNSLAAHFYVHLWHNYSCLRMLPKYGIPSL